MKSPLKSVLMHSIERSAERIPRDTSHDPSAGDSVSGYKNGRYVSVERNEATHIGKCVTDICLSVGRGSVDEVVGVTYEHKIEDEPIINFGGTPDELTSPQLARVAFNLSGLSKRLERHPVRD